MNSFHDFRNLIAFIRSRLVAYDHYQNPISDGGRTIRQVPIMNRLLRASLLFLLCAAPALAQKSAAPQPHLNWQPWSDQAFADAKRENRFVLLDLEAVWCHWCHVMDANTYSDPAVKNRRRYIAGSRPDLRPDSPAIKDFGWPATIVFDANGREIVKRQGYLAPDEMASLLQAIIDDPSPGPSVEAPPKLTIPANAILAAPIGTKLVPTEGDKNSAVEVLIKNFWIDRRIGYATCPPRRQTRRYQRQTSTNNRILFDPARGRRSLILYRRRSTSHFRKIQRTVAENRAFISIRPVFGSKNISAVRKSKLLFKTFEPCPTRSPTSQDADVIEGHRQRRLFRARRRPPPRPGIPRVDKR